MIRGYKELQRLGDLLDAELNGRHYDNDELNRLANNISQHLRHSGPHGSASGRWHS